MRPPAFWLIDSPASRNRFLPTRVLCGSIRNRCNQFARVRFSTCTSKQESRMKFVTLAAIAALTATPALTTSVLADPVAREQAKADLHQARADATKAQMQKEAAQAEAD